MPHGRGIGHRLMAMAGVADSYEGAAVPAAPVTAPVTASSASCNHLKTDLISTEQVWFFEVKRQLKTSVVFVFLFFWWMFLIFQVALATSNYASTRHELAIEHVAEFKPRTSHGRFIL